MKPIHPNGYDLKQVVSLVRRTKIKISYFWHEFGANAVPCVQGGHHAYPVERVNQALEEVKKIGRVQ